MLLTNESAPLWARYYNHHSNMSHRQHEGQGEVAEGAGKEKTDIWESKESDGGQEVNLRD